MAVTISGSYIVEKASGAAVRKEVPQAGLRHWNVPGATGHLEGLFGRILHG